MDVRLIKRLNELWQPIYPFLGKWILKWCPEDIGRVLELGPFSGGISTSLLKHKPQLQAFCLVDQEELIEPIRAAFHPHIEFIIGGLKMLPFRPSFDLIIFRGAFFFLTSEMIKESYSSLRPGGYALLGGGYGPLTPKEEIEKIALESKKLNYRLGKRSISREVLARMIDEAGLNLCSTIIEDGGLWVLVNKEK